MNYKWTKMNKPLKYPVYDNRKLVIPAGATDVEIAFGQSSKIIGGKSINAGSHQNAYRWNGKIYNA